MKKLFALMMTMMLAVICSFGLTACGNSVNDVDEIKKAGKLVVATEASFPPFESKDGEKFVGIDIEIAEAIAKELGVELEVKDMIFDSVVTSVQKGQADLAIAALTINEERAEAINFSTDYFGASQYVVVAANDTTFDACKTKEDVDAILAGFENGTKIAAQSGTTGYYYVKGSEAFEFAGFKNLNAVGLETPVLGAQGVVNGQYKALIVDDEVAAQVVKANDGVKTIAISLNSEKYGIGVNKQAPKLLETVNKVLADLKASGELQAIISKYTSEAE